MAPSSRPKARSGRSGAERAAARAHRLAATRLGSTAADHSYRLPWAQSVPRTAQEPPLPVSCIALWPLWAGALAAAAVGDERGRVGGRRAVTSPRSSFCRRILCLCGCACSQRVARGRELARI